MYDRINSLKPFGPEVEKIAFNDLDVSVVNGCAVNQSSDLETPPSLKRQQSLIPTQIR